MLGDRRFQYVQEMLLGRPRSSELMLLDALLAAITFSLAEHLVNLHFIGYGLFTAALALIGM